MTRESQSRIRPGIRRLLGLDVVRKDALAAELEDELQLHLELRAEQLKRQGLSDDAAMKEARARYGRVDEATAEIRKHAERREHEMKRRITFDSLAQDVRFAFRTLGRSKAWTTVAVLTLALGIGANTAVFSVVNDLLLNPLRYPNAGRLVLISRVNEKSKIEMTPTLAQLSAWRTAKSLDGLEGMGSATRTLETSTGDPTTAHVGMVASSFAHFAGAQVLRGRFILPEDERADAPPVVVVSAHVWKNRFGDASDVTGKTLKIEGQQYSVVGVLQDDVRIPSYNKDPVDVWISMPAKGYLGGPLVGRLAKTATVATARGELQAIAHSLAAAENDVGSATFDIDLRSPGSAGQTRSSVFMLAGAVCLLLLIACANVAHLLLARSAARGRELSIRAALGAGRGRIVRQLVTESSILSIAGCVAGLVIGQLSLRAIVSLRPANMGELATAHIDVRVLLVTITLSAVSGIAFGLIAGFSGSSGVSFDTLRSTVASTLDRTRNRVRSLLVITENALSVVLLIGAILLIRTVINLHHVHPGFDASNVYAMTVDLPEARYESESARQVYADRLLAEARLVPGVEQVTIAANAPGRVGAMIGKWVAEGETPTANDGSLDFTAMNTVRPEYFDIIRMPLVSGRTFGENAVRNHEVIVSSSLARQLWGNTNVVGRRLRMDGRATNEQVPWNVVAAVTPDATLLSLTDNGATPGIYFPTAKAPDRHLTLIVRMRSGIAPVTAFRRVFLSVDHSVSPPDVVSATDLLLRSVASQRFLMALLALFAFLAVTLSAIGLYGVITYMVSQSTREIGVRLALGAARRDVTSLVMRKGVTLSVFGLSLGLLVSFFGARLLTHTVYGITTTDPLSYATGALLLLAIAIGACVAPTIRAIRIDPMLAMRSE